MPELPEVETSRRGIEPFLLDQQVREVVVRFDHLRWPIPSDLNEQMQGHRVLAVDRRGKYLLIKLAHGCCIIHLGMSGNLRIIDAGLAPQKHDHVDIVLASNKALRLCDPRRFGAVLWTSHPVEAHKLLANLGPEPMSEAFTAKDLFDKSRGKTQCVKTYIMDSKQVVGVGNIYANESLFMAGIKPTLAAGKISLARYKKLHTAIVEVLGSAIEQGGTTLKDFVNSDGKPGYFKQSLAVYGRGGEPCLSCGRDLQELKIAQRATVYCKSCQR